LESSKRSCRPTNAIVSENWIALEEGVVAECAIVLLAHAANDNTQAAKSHLT
jgi:hypothetical protein